MRTSVIRHPEDETICEYCVGRGRIYTHSPDCNNDLCALSGGYYDCDGEVVECSCSIENRIEKEKEAQMILEEKQSSYRVLSAYVNLENLDAMPLLPDFAGAFNGIIKGSKNNRFIRTNNE